VDINSNSVKICRLRLWIELLKNAYYKTSPPNPSPQGEGSKNKDQKFPSPIGRGIKGEGELETLPNIDINIKHGNSLISRFPLDADLKTALRKSKSSLEDYRQAVKIYLNAEDKQQKRAMLKLIRDIKANLTTVLHGQDQRKTKFKKFGRRVISIGKSSFCCLRKVRRKRKQGKGKLISYLMKLIG
jgi:adenine-specific DNA-methyltransferase